MTEAALNPFYVHTTLPPNSGGDPEQRAEIRYQRQTQLEALDGWPITDRVYRNPVTGRFFKVRAGRNASSGAAAFGTTSVLITVAQCDAEGYALAWEGGMISHKVAPPHVMTIPGDGAGDVADVIEGARLIQCAECELAVRNEELTGALLPLYETPPAAAAAPDEEGPPA